MDAAARGVRGQLRFRKSRPVSSGTARQATRAPVRCWRHDCRWRTGRRRAQHDQQLLLDVPNELDNAEPAKPRDTPENDKDEDQTRGIDAGHLLAQRQKRANAVFADREGHRAKNTDRRRPHDDRDHAEQRLRDQIDDSKKRLSGLTQKREGEREKEREEQFVRSKPDANGCTELPVGSAVLSTGAFKTGASFTPPFSVR